MTADHLEACARLLIAAFDGEPWNEHWTPETALKELRWALSTPGFLGFVYLLEGPVGFAAGYREYGDDGETFYLRTLCVRPDLQGKGVGSSLVQRLREVLTGMGVRSIYLITTREGTAAKAFYERHGYRVVPADIAMPLE